MRIIMKTLYEIIIRDKESREAKPKGYTLVYTIADRSRMHRRSIEVYVKEDKKCVRNEALESLCIRAYCEISGKIDSTKDRRFSPKNPTLKIKITR